MLWSERKLHAAATLTQTNWNWYMICSGEWMMNSLLQIQNLVYQTCSDNSSSSFSIFLSPATSSASIEFVCSHDNIELSVCMMCTVPCCFTLNTSVYYFVAHCESHEIWLKDLLLPWQKCFFVCFGETHLTEHRGQRTSAAAAAAAA